MGKKVGEKYKIENYAKGGRGLGKNLRSPDTLSVELFGMPVKREPCRFFQRGSCQFGDTCRYLHVTQQQPKSNIFGFGSQSGSDQHQKSNPYGFGVHNNSQSKAGTDFGSKDNQFKPFENKWTRSSPTAASATPSSRRSDNQPQTSNHECTNPESCRNIIIEDLEHERPLWKLTCYGHSRNCSCDIVGDISYEELRAAAYDDAKRGLNLQSIVERERNLVNTKSIEFENLRKPREVPLNSTASQIPFPSATANSFLQTAQNSAPPLVSSFSQFGTSLNVGFGPRSSAPPNNVFLQPNPSANSNHASSGFGTNNFPSVNVGSFGSQFPTSTPGSITHNVEFGNTVVMRPQSNQISTSVVSSQFSTATSQPLILSDGPSSASNPIGRVTAEVQSPNNMQREKISGDMSIWLKKKWTPGEVPEEEPPDALVEIEL